MTYLFIFIAHLFILLLVPFNCFIYILLYCTFFTYLDFFWNKPIYVFISGKKVHMYT